MKIIGDPSLYRQIIEQLQKASTKNLACHDAMTILYLCTIVGMDKKLFRRYQDVLTTIWQRLEIIHECHDTVIGAFVEYIRKLIDFDRKLLDKFTLSAILARRDNCRAARSLTKRTGPAKHAKS